MVNEKRNQPLSNTVPFLKFGKYNPLPDFFTLLLSSLKDGF